MTSLTHSTRRLWWPSQLRTDRVTVEERDGVVWIRGFTAPAAWVGPALAGTVAFGVVVSAIAAGFCFSCAAQAPPYVPFVIFGLLALYFRGFRIRIRGGEAIVEETFAFLPLRRRVLSNARASLLPERGDARCGVALSSERGETIFLGSPRTGRRLLEAVQSALAPQSQ